MKIDVNIDLSGLQKRIRDKQKQFQNESDRAVRSAAQNIASDAKTNHPYTDRTGNLTKSIKPIRNGQADYTVVAGEDYASFVEYGTKRGPKGRVGNMPYPYLEPAAKLVEPTYRDAIRKILERLGDK